MRIIRFSLCIGLLALLAACASNPEDRPELTEGEYYEQASEALEKKNFLSAIEQLEEIQARFPYGDYAEQVQLDLVFAHYRAHDYASATAAAQRFVRSFPASEHLDYALYMDGLANYYLEGGILMGSLFSKETASRDLSSYRDAFRAFQELIRRFPDSEHAPDARARMLHIRNQLAARELHVARYYARRRAFIAAANRAQHVVQHYQGTTSVPRALAILTLSYESLDQPALAEKSRQVLALNWPESEYLEGDQVAISWWPSPEGKGLLSLLTFDLL
jgi:outer membrane protein assembly factor BamD